VKPPEGAQLELLLVLDPEVEPDEVANEENSRSDWCSPQWRQRTSSGGVPRRTRSEKAAPQARQRYS